ncbi:MAG: class I SAM-dependent methyltransferase, partial [Chloroflexota bacterium]|nr:class I SAM-dependent methyltransferase [Chloroflexota bacterium]
NIATQQGDMRHFAHLVDHPFDLVWQPYSLNFVPDARAVFHEVSQVVRPSGLYWFNCANPFVSGLGEHSWNGDGYTLKLPYQDGAAITYPDASWVHESSAEIPPPREYRHTLSTLVNGLIEAGFVLHHLSDTRDYHPDPDAEPGTWSHFTAVAPPWLAFWAVYRPDSL